MMSNRQSSNGAAPRRAAAPKNELEVREGQSDSPSKPGEESGKNQTDTAALTSRLDESASRESALERFLDEAVAAEMAQEPVNGQEERMLETAAQGFVSTDKLHTESLENSQAAEQEALAEPNNYDDKIADTTGDMDDSFDAGKAVERYVDTRELDRLTLEASEQDKSIKSEVSGESLAAKMLMNQVLEEQATTQNNLAGLREQIKELANAQPRTPDDVKRLAELLQAGLHSIQKGADAVMPTVSDSNSGNRANTDLATRPDKGPSEME